MTPKFLLKKVMNKNITWAELLASEKQKAYFSSILQYIKQERGAGKEIYPEDSEMFSAFDETPYENVKIVILGQDPYHGQGQAHGLSFSVKPGIVLPPSLKNIYKELQADLSIPISSNGCLTQWANQGVLLLNTSLSVERGKPQSHANIGWTGFTDAVIQLLNDSQSPIVFLLWGAHAQNKASLITNTHHLILKAAHPSPFSAYRGFFGCKHFSKANDFLQSQGRGIVEWG